MQAYDPIIDADVKQRKFTPADDEQAVLMEMFRESQLQKYYDDLHEIVYWKEQITPLTIRLGVAGNAAAAEEGEHTAALEGPGDRPVARLSRFALWPMVACAHRALPCCACAARTWTSHVQLCRANHCAARCLHVVPHALGNWYGFERSVHAWHCRLGERVQMSC